jgi:hypothetical protein
MKNAVFWDATPCSYCKNRRFRGKSSVHHHCDKNRRARNKVRSKQQLQHAAKKQWWVASAFSTASSPLGPHLSCYRRPYSNGIMGHRGDWTLTSIWRLRRTVSYSIEHKQKTNSVAFSLQANYTDWATATCWRNLVPTFADRGVSRVRATDPPRSLISVSCTGAAIFLEKNYNLARGGVVVELLCYKSEYRGFETRSGKRMSSICVILPAPIVLGVYSASNRNEYQRQK